jgi:mannose-6-phosphate isomerase-like protein (cupin superfamily)
MEKEKRNYYECPIDVNPGSLRSLKGTDDMIKLRDIYMLFDYKDTDDKYQIGAATLHPGCETGGHAHEACDEVYHFIDGYGRQMLDGKVIEVGPGDTMIVPAKTFHKTDNPGCVPLKYFWVVIGKDK